MATDSPQKTQDSKQEQSDTIEIGKEAQSIPPTPEIFKGDFDKQESQAYLIAQDGFAISFYLPGATAADKNNYGYDRMASIFLAYYPCELVAAQIVYGVKSSIAGAGLDLKRKLADTSTEQVINLTAPIFLLTSTADIIQTATTTDFDPRYRYLDKGDSLCFRFSGSDATGCRDFCATFHFKYSGRGESRF